MPATLSAPPKPKLEKVTTKLLAEWSALDESRKKLYRDADAISKRQKEIEKAVAAHVAEKATGKVREVRTCGYRLSIVTVAGTIAWKTLFGKLLGKEAIAKAEADVPPRDKLTIEKL